MAVSDKVRREVFQLDHGECQFLHSEPYPADQISHFVHQGAGGLPPEHWVNQPPNLAASCGACHARLHDTGTRYVWTKFDRKRGMMEITRGGRLVHPRELWFHEKSWWAETRERFLKLEQACDAERAAQWRVAGLLAYLAEFGSPAAVNGSRDWLDLAAQCGVTSAEARRRVRAEKFRQESGLARGTIGAVSVDVADRLRGIEREEELCDVAGWFTSLPPAEAWSRFNAAYPPPERRTTYRAFVGEYREVEAADEAAALEALGDGAVIVRGGSVIRGTRKMEAA